MARGRGFVTRIAIVTVAGMTIGVSEAPATVAEQRARLPPAAECQSPIAGRWKALVYSHTTSSWYQRTLELHQDEADPTRLIGVQYVEYWAGPVTEPEPPATCIRHQRGKMTGRGTFINDEVAFYSDEYELVEIICGGRGGYNPDNFTGRLDRELQEFQAINNDGGTSVNEPTLFRRIACLDDGVRQERTVEPPAFFPKRRTGGC